MKTNFFKSKSTLLFVFYLLLFVSFLFLVPAEATTFRINSLQKGLVGHWDLNKSSLKSANVFKDSTPNGNNGTSVNTPVFTTDRHGQANKALSFNGTSDYISIVNNLGNIQSVLLWVKPTTNSQNIIDLNGSTYISSSSGTISATGFTSPTIYVNGASSSVITANNWQHIAITTATNISASAVNIGKISTNYLNGSISDVRIYNRALSAVEISQLYNQYRPKYIINPFSNQPVSNGLVGHWYLASGARTSATVFRDYSGNNNSGTSINTPTFTTNQKNVINSAMSFNGTSDYVSVGNASLGISSQITLAAWVKFTGVGDGSTRIIDKSYTSCSSPWSMWDIRMAGGVNQFAFDITSGGSNSILNGLKTDYSANVWHHVVGTYTGSSMYLYIDGVLDNSKSQTGTIDTNSQNVIIGKHLSCNSQYFNGLIDDTRIYNRALSATEISQLYNQYRPLYKVNSLSKGLVGHWPLDKSSLKSANVFADKTPNGNNGTSANTPTFTTDRHGQSNKAMSFNGTSDYVSVGDSASLNFTNAFTLVAWVYPSVNASNDFIIGKTQAYTVNGMELEWGWTSEVKPVVQWYGTSFTYGPANTYPIANQWNHLVAIYNGTTVTYYLNGVSDGGYTPSNAPPNTNFPIKIGTIDDRTGSYDFDGSISDVRIFNRALSAAEVSQLYNSY